MSGYAAPGPWRLVEVEGRAIGPVATLSFAGPGRLEGVLPCGPWRARQTAPYPWFDLSALEAAPGCPATALEAQIVDLLARAAFAEASGPVLILSDEAGAEMVLRLQR